MASTPRPAVWLALAAMVATLALPMRSVLHTLGHARIADRLVAAALCTSAPRPVDGPSTPAPASHAQQCASACCATATPAAPPPAPYPPLAEAPPGPLASGKPAAIVAARRALPPPARAPPAA